MKKITRTVELEKIRLINIGTGETYLETEVLPEYANKYWRDLEKETGFRLYMESLGRVEKIYEMNLIDFIEYARGGRKDE